MRERSSHFPIPPEPWTRFADFVPDVQVTSPDRPSTTPRTEPSRTTDAPPPERLAPTTNAEKQPRLTLSGRLGSSITYGQTPKGQPKAHFVLGVHTPTETGVKTDWRAILTFGERVNQLRALNLTKGEAARVVGYVHTKETKTKAGTKTVEEMYAVAIQRL